MADTFIIDLMNGIWSDGTGDYQNYVPEATQTNIADVGNPILTYQSVQNEFLNTLVNKIALTIVRHKLLTNPLAPLKKGEMPLGFDVEEMHVNRAVAETYDPTGEGLLDRTLPDVVVEYHRLNRQDMYPVTISKQQLKQAFTSWDHLQSLIDGIVSSMYDGDSDDEFILMKNLMATAVEKEHVTMIYAVDLDKPTELVENFKNVSSYMSFASSNFNKYSEVNSTELAPIPPRRTKTEIGDQVLIIRADIANKIDVNVLANAFNLSKAEFLARRVLVDNFGDADDVIAFLCDKDFFQVYDQLRTTEEFYNAKGLYWNYFYHVWQVMSYSLMVNAVAFTTESAPVAP